MTTMSDGLEILDEDGLSVPSPSSRESTGGNGASHVSLPVVPSRDWNEDRAPVEGAEEDDFTLSRSGPMTVEELDLVPMVDVAFQLVLFFMVTATTVLYKTLEIPKPTTDQAPSSVAQGHSRSVEDLQKDYILVEIDAEGAIKIDREPVPANVDCAGRAAADGTGEDGAEDHAPVGGLPHAAPQCRAGVRRGDRGPHGDRDRPAEPAAGAGAERFFGPGAGRCGSPRSGWGCDQAPAPPAAAGPRGACSGRRAVLTRKGRSPSGTSGISNPLPALPKAC